MKAFTAPCLINSTGVSAAKGAMKKVLRARMKVSLEVRVSFNSRDFEFVYFKSLVTIEILLAVS